MAGLQRICAHHQKLYSDCDHRQGRVAPGKDLSNECMLSGVLMLIGYCSQLLRHLYIQQRRSQDCSCKDNREDSKKGGHQGRRERKDAVEFDQS